VTGAPHSRRETLRRAARAAGAVASAGMLRPALAAAQTEDEELRDFLVEAIGLEQVTVLAYSTAADQAGPDLKRVLEELRDQEQAHANALRSAIDELGFDPPEAPDSPTDTEVFDGVEGLDDDAAKTLTDRLEAIGDADGLDQLLDQLLSLEDEQITYYCTEGPRLDSYDLATTAASIAGCQAQHVVLLETEVGHEPGDAAASVAETAAQAGDAATAAEE
jgi:rubrerythrin